MESQDEQFQAPSGDALCVSRSVCVAAASHGNVLFYDRLSTHAVGRFLLSGLDCCLWMWQQQDVWMCELANATRGLMMFDCVFPCPNPKALTNRCHRTVETGRNCVS